MSLLGALSSGCLIANALIALYVVSLVVRRWLEIRRGGRL